MDGGAAVPNGTDRSADAADPIQPGSASGKQTQFVSDLSDLILGV